MMPKGRTYTACYPLKLSPVMMRDLRRAAKAAGLSLAAFLRREIARLAA